MFQKQLTNNQYTTSQPSFKNRSNKKTYIVSKLPEDSNLKAKIESAFDNADEYLKINNKMFIGK
jgi:hypothetical protein